MSMRRAAAEICRDEECDLEGLHATGQCCGMRRRRRKERPLKTTQAPWRVADPAGLSEAVLRAVPPTLPTHFSAIYDGVRNDYGSVHERTVYRHIRKILRRGELIKVNLRLGFAAYIRPKAKLLADLSTMRDVVESMVDLEPENA